ncbi:MAG TPA: acyl transferase [Flavisolibacter sp.]|nr:acyl transferase [Flavisolibacter sp.]
MSIEIPKQFESIDKVFSIQNAKEFDFIALKVYHFQFANNPVYQAYCKIVKRTPEIVKSRENIPFLPISFFKTHIIKSGEFEPGAIFKSSGTTGSLNSIHYVKDPFLYLKSCMIGFRQFYGDIKEYCIIGLLPSYLQQGNSSLVYMVDHFIKKSGHKESGFYLDDFKKLYDVLKQNEEREQKTILIGVTYALLDFAEQFPIQLKYTIVMETGGMKGRRKEMIRKELHNELKKRLNVEHIHSEYGMTELLSQAYSIDGIFKSPPWMKIVLRDETDPFTISENSKDFSSGAINVIDLANIYSCGFIATEDTGRFHDNGRFEVMGRMDNTDIRGCSLLAL